MNGDHAIEIIVWIRQALLAIADTGLHAGIVAINRLRHALAELDRVVVLRLEIFEAKMLAKAGA